MNYRDLRTKIDQCKSIFGKERATSLLMNWSIPYIRADDDKYFDDNIEFDDSNIYESEQLIAIIDDATPDGKIYLRNANRDKNTPPVERDFWELPQFLTRNPWIPPSEALPWLLDFMLDKSRAAVVVGREVAPTQKTDPVEQPIDPEAIAREQNCLARLKAQRAALRNDGAPDFSRLVKDLYGLRDRLPAREVSFVSGLLRRAYEEPRLIPTERQRRWLSDIARRLVEKDS